ncbi:MAG: PBP1A family penicillin-binding protein [Candidatus Krumholzibacteria bacterium]|nr:PBP1A family penicillin-binding protein [Candidatus Krumholzibacteria bacterium]
MQFRPLTHGEKMFLWIAGLALVCIIGIGTAAVKWFSRDLPSMERLEMIEPSLKTRILASDGSVIKEFYEENRVFLPLDQIPPKVQKTFLAVEDRRFYQHSGIDMQRIFVTMCRDLIHWSRAQGASTITQQISTDLFLNKKEQTFPRKIREALLAFKIERTYSKDEILEIYLNQIYFGEGTYGIEAASRKYFGKSVKDIGLNQMALLAGLPKNPGGYNPFTNPERAAKRVDLVLKAMEEFHVITKAERDSLRATSLNLVQKTSEKRDFAGYFCEYIRQEIEAKYGSRSIYRDGYTVYTTIDAGLQQAAEQNLETYDKQLEEANSLTSTRAAYEEAVALGKTPKAEYLQSALVAIDPRNGHILALVGGRNFRETQYNRAMQAPRQPGSAFKPFLYIAALENGLNPSDMLYDTPLVVELPNGDVWKPRNYDEKFHGAVSLREALAYSYNIPSIKLIQRVGTPSVIDVAKRMGIKSRLQNVLSLALGTNEVTLLELTSAYGVLAAEGMRAEPMAITKIEDRNGNVLEEYREYHEEALQPDVAYVITDMLTSVVDEVHGTGASARRYGLDIPVAGKTGTTDEYTDGWFIGYNPELVIGVWTGFDERRPIGRGMTGANVALPIWVETMKAAYPTNRGPAFNRPSNIIEELICQESGLLSTPYCPKVVREIFIEGNEPTRECDLHRVSSYDLLDKDKDFRQLDKEASRDRIIPQ